ncbi:MAG TPA: MarC family protein [Candidatus Bathyarchaeia archaeon]|nr:MarC family protein [Candidatus Bathyarchaeia archaeon]
MLDFLDFAILTFGSLVAVMEPFSTTAVFATLTKDMDSTEKKKVVLRTAVVSFLVLIFFALTGHLIFRVFGITLPVFQIAGGILLVMVAFEMLRPGQTDVPSQRGEDIAIVPLAFPLTSGPGSITTVILLVSRAENLLQTFVVPASIFVGVLFTYLAMTFSTGLFKRFGNHRLQVVTTLMAIIVLAIEFSLS